MIFFDIDGTLIDHKKAEYLGVKGFYSEHCTDFDIDEDLFYESWCRISDRHFQRFLMGEISFAQQRLERIRDVFGISEIDITYEDAAEKFNIYRKYYEESLLPYEDVDSCLKEVKGYRKGIISNGDFKQQMFKLNKINAIDGFDPIVTAGDVGVAKPSIEIFQIACKMANVKIENCIYVGDDLETDILPCMKAGMKGIWLNRKNEKLEYPEVKMIYDLLELEDEILKL